MFRNYRTTFNKILWDRYYTARGCQRENTAFQRGNHGHCGCQGRGQGEVGQGTVAVAVLEKLHWRNPEDGKPSLMFRFSPRRKMIRHPITDTGKAKRGQNGTQQKGVTAKKKKSCQPTSAKEAVRQACREQGDLGGGCGNGRLGRICSGEAVRRGNPARETSVMREEAGRAVQTEPGQSRQEWRREWMWRGQQTRDSSFTSPRGLSKPGEPGSVTTPGPVRFCAV